MRRLLTFLGLLTILASACSRAQDAAVVKPPLREYEVATIKQSDPDEKGRGVNFRGRHLLVKNMTIEDLITLAYEINPKQLDGGPGWLRQRHFDMDILASHEESLSLAQARVITRQLLEERFGLKSHEEQKELSAFVLTKTRTGPKFEKSKSDPQSAPTLGGPPGMYTVRNGSMAEFAQVLQGTLDRPVLDQTGLLDRYDFTLRWTPDDSQYGGKIATQNSADNGSNGDAPPPLVTAIQEQLGLRLEAKKASVKRFVVDRIDPPSAN